VLMKHYMAVHNPEQLSLVFSGATTLPNSISRIQCRLGFKDVYDQQILKPAYPMAFYYVKVHNATPLALQSNPEEPDQEFVCAIPNLHHSNMHCRLVTSTSQVY
jgi:hypothetical protein